ncbi:MAG: Alkylhydroperoxidase family enzyme, contains CxxC motif [Chloroflexi bacterium]|jgi:alkylhydroperoxidase family enzyme|nr:MAG: Alkylhydroperoxidase family enzyme, contains CxxC motif [Chloroflexota bacterium]
MSWLKGVSGDGYADAFSLSPGAEEADAAMREQVRLGLGERDYALMSLVIAGLLGCPRFMDSVRGLLPAVEAVKVIEDWREAGLSSKEQAAMVYVEKGTLRPHEAGPSDVEVLRAAGFNDTDILSLATAIAYQNHAMRVAAALGVEPL